MSNDPTIYPQTYAFFLMEAPELLQTIEQDLLSLKEDHSRNKIHSLMRMTHTLKGAAASVGLETLKTVAHSLEDVFKALYNPTVVIDSLLEVLLFQAYECLRLPLNAEFTNTPVNESEVLNRAEAVFSQLQEKLGDYSCEKSQVPTSAELGFDITQSIFETDVRERLAALAAALVQPCASEVATILRSSATVFVGLAESFILPGFGAIAQTALAALDAHPDKAVFIAQIALADFQRGQALVLAGDRTYAGEPSAALQQLAGAEAPQSTTLEQTVRVDLERLERLNHLTGDLLTKQNQQGSANEQLQETFQKLQDKVRRLQQTLNRIRNCSNRMLVRPERQQSSAGEDLNPWCRLDSLEMDPDSELYVLLQSALEETVQLEETTGEVALFNQQCSQTLEKQQRLLTDVRDDLTGARMSSLGDIFSRLPRVLQQLEAVHGKPTELQLSGTQVLVDKTIAQKLYDPLLHLVRNAFDHGIESPEVRRQLGKPETGQIRIHAYQQERWTVIEVSDDGKGLDFQKIRERAMEMNWLTPEQASSRSEEELLHLLFEPGFSTASQVNDLSGRGVGLDVVRSQLQLLQGSITVQSKPQRGTTFVLLLPLTLTIAKWDVPDLTTVVPVEPSITDVSATSNLSLEDIWGSEFTCDDAQIPPSPSLLLDQFFVWRAGSTAFVLPYSSIEEYLVPTDQIILAQKQRFLHWREQMIPIYQLSELIRYNYPLPDATFGKAEDEAVLTLVLKQRQRIFALESAINCLVTEPELMIEPFGTAIAPPSYTYGCSVLEDKRLVLVINALVLLNRITDEQ